MKPQILEVFKNTLPNRLYWVLFPIDDLRLAVETVKWILTKEIGTCPNILVEIDVTDMTPFFIRLYHTKEDDKVILDKEIKRLVLFRYSKGRIFSLF